MIDEVEANGRSFEYIFISVKGMGFALANVLEAGPSW